MASSRPTSSATNASFYHATSSSSSSNQNTNIPVGSLSLMVARFDTNNKNPSPALTLIPQQRLPIATRSNVVSSSNLPGGNAIRATSVIGQPLSAAPVTVSSSTPSISVRTTQLIGGQHQTTVPVVNLSTINNSNSHVQKQISTQRSLTANALPIESVSLVMTNASESNVINRSMTRFTPNDSKSSATAHGINKTTAQRSNIIGPTIVSTQHKVGLTTTSNVPQIARFGIFSHVNPGSGSNKQGNIINLTAASLPKGHLILNSANITAASNTVHNMVTVSGTSIGQTAKITSNVTATSTLNRQVVVTTTTPFGQIGTSQSQHRSIPLITTTTNSLQQPSTQQSVLQSPATTTTLTASPLRPAILSPANSPIKQTQHNLTPSSPRPSILSRKRTDQGNLTPTHSFKPSSTITTTTLTTTSTTVSSPLKPRTTINSTNESSLNEESRVFGANEVPQQNSGTAPATPTSDSMQTPRKKPRKQLLEPFNLKSSQNIQLLNSEIKVKEEYCNDKDAQLNNTTNTNNNTNNKRRRASLLSAYNMQWKALQYHFLRYSDVKPKPEKKLTLSELSNEGLQRKNGWKIHHLATQMEVMSDNEMCVNKRLVHFLQTFQNDASNSPLLSSLSSASITPSTSTFTSSSSSSSSIPNSSHSSSSDNNKAQNNVSNSNNNNSCLMMTTVTNSDSPFDVNCIAAKLTDLIRGNLQRSNLFSDQINEARQLVIKLTNDHKERVGKLTKKCANKRTYITK